MLSMSGCWFCTKWNWEQRNQPVKVEDSFAPSLDDETETIEHLLAEPKTKCVTVDGVLCFGKENAEKCLNFDDFSSGFDYGLNTYTGGRHSAHPRGPRSAHSRQGDYELELGVLDGLLDEVEEVEDIHATNGLASPCDDFLLDIGFTGKVSELLASFWNSELILDIPPPPSFVAITVVGVEPRTGEEPFLRTN